MITLWHNPRCSKSRAALALLRDGGTEVAVRLYLDDAPSRAELEAVRAALGHPPVIGMMRPKDALFRALGLSVTDSDDRLMDAMAAHPALIERPVAIRGDTAALGRPPENVLRLV